MFSRKWALVAVFMVQLLYGLNYTFAKTVINDGFVGAFGFVVLRVVGASLMFWLLGLFLPKEKIDKSVCKKNAFMIVVLTITAM